MALTEAEELELLELEAEQSKSSFGDAIPSFAMEQKQPMTLGGFGKNVVEDAKANVMGLAQLGNAMPSTAVGNVIGDIVKTYRENQSVVDPNNARNAVVNKYVMPWIKNPVQTAADAMAPIRQGAGAVLSQAGKTIVHPIQTAYEQPITTAMYATPVAKGAVGKFGLTKASRLAKVEPLMSEATQVYRDVLRPTQGELKNIEVRGGKNIDDFYRIAAEEKLPIKSTGGKEPKIDTSDARVAIEQKLGEIHKTLNKSLENSPQQFSLKDIASKAKKELRSSIKNDTEYKYAEADVDEYINDAIQSRGGEFVNAKTLNEIKQGMWSVGYNAMKPTAKATARKIGFIAKETLNDALSDSGLKELNELSGKYSALDNLLENAHGRVVRGGQVGKYFAQTIGGMAGSHIPVVGSPIGAWIGGKINNALSSPERATATAASRVDLARKYSGGKYAPQIDKILKGNK